jgi:MFS transporter, Spinster family, sphingosine-1-phosphate transporter
MAAPTLDYYRDQRPADRPTNYAWVVVGLLSVVAALNYLDRLMITHMRKPLVAELHISETQFSLLTSLFLWSYAACSPLGGYLADRVGRRWVIVASLFFWSLATALSGFAQSAEHLMIARLLMGVSEACYIPAALALISDYHRGPTRSLATGIHMVGLYVGSSIGALSGYISASLGWRAGFHIFGWFGVAYFILLLFTLRDAPRSVDTAAPGSAEQRVKTTIGPALQTLFSRKGFYLLLGINVMVGIANWIVNIWLPTFLGEKFPQQLTSGDASAMTIVIQVSSFVAVLACGAWSDRWSRNNPKARAIVPAIMWCAAAPALFVMATMGYLPLTIVCLIIFGFGRGGFDANQMPVVREVVPERYSATAYGFLNMIGTMVGGLAGLAGGALRDAKIDSAVMFQVSAGAILVAGILLLAIPIRRSTRDDGTILPPDELDAATITETGSVPLGAVTGTK